MTERCEAVWVGHAIFERTGRVLSRSDGSEIPLRPQSSEVLDHLVQQEGLVVSRGDLIDAVWPGLSVTDDSLTQCITDIRKAIGDKDHKIVTTIPRKGYRLVLERSILHSKAKPVVPSQVPTRPIIAVLPFEASGQEEQRWYRVGRGLSISISDELAREKQLGVIGPETAYEAGRLGLLAAGKQLDATFVLGGEIWADGSDLHISARLLDAQEGSLLWSERWQRQSKDYMIIHDDIVHRIYASLVAHFWFGVINRVVAEKAKKKAAPSLSAYEQYLLGIEHILWKQADYSRALSCFYQAVEIDPKYARAWGMIGIMKQWIADITEGEMQEKMIVESKEAIHRAALFEPHDPFIVFLGSSPHIREGRIEAAKRAIRTAVDLAPNNSDILAMAAWQSPSAGIAGNEPLNWARKAVDLNPKGPPWHKIGLGCAAFSAGFFEEAIVALEDAPPHHKKYVNLAAAYMALGQEGKAQEAAKSLCESFPNYTLSGHMKYPPSPEIQRLIDFAARAGIPVGS